MLPDGSKTYGMLLDEMRAEATEVIQLLQAHDFDKSYIETVLAFPWAARLQGDMRERFVQVLEYICEHIAPSLLQTTRMH